MRNRTTTPESATPTCWQREAPSACLRIELPDGTQNLLSYGHFVTATLTRSESGLEIIRISFSSHELEIEGRGLRDLLLGLQDFAVKWIRTAPARYQPSPVDAAGIVSSIKITTAE